MTYKTPSPEQRCTGPSEARSDRRCHNYASREGLCKTHLRIEGKRLERQHQTVFGDSGNCFATCIACLLRLPVADVPNFCSDRPSRWLSDCLDWLRERGWGLVRFDDWMREHLEIRAPGIMVIACGRASRGARHAVLMRDGKLVHDPYPGGEGLLEVDDCYALVPLFEP